MQKVFGFEMLIENALRRNNIDTWDDLYIKVCNGSVEKIDNMGFTRTSKIAYALLGKGYDAKPLSKYLGIKDVDNKGNMKLKQLSNYFDKYYVWNPNREPGKTIIWSEESGQRGQDWDHIRKIICHLYGASLVKDIKPEYIDDAIETGMDFISIYNKAQKRFYHVLDEVKKEGGSDV